MLTFDTCIFSCVCVVYTEDYDEEGAVTHVRRLLDVVACTSFLGRPERGAKGGGAAEKPRPRKGIATERPKPSKSPPRANSPHPASVESVSVTIATDTVVDGEGETSGTRPKLGSFYDFFSLAHLTPPLQCKRPGSATRPISSNGPHSPAHLDNMCLFSS